jgi:hypothetical protein
MIFKYWEIMGEGGVYIYVLKPSALDDDGSFSDMRRVREEKRRTNPMKENREAKQMY